MSARRKLLLALSLVLAGAWPAHATMTCSATNFSAVAINTSSATPTVAMPTSAPANATLILAILDRTSTTTNVVSVIGSVNATGWAEASEGTTRHVWIYYKVGASTGTDTVTVTFDGIISSQLIAGWCSDDSGSAQTFDAASTPSDTTTTTTHNSNTVATAGAGGIVGAIGMNTSATFTAVGSGETEVSGDAGGQRLSLFFEPTAGAGTVGFETTSSVNTSGTFLVASFLNPGGAVSVKRGPSMGILP